MKLETKLGLSSAVLIGAMLVSAMTAHLRVKAASRRAADITEKRLPLLRESFQLSLHEDNTLQALQSNLLFAASQSKVTEYRNVRAAEMKETQESLAKLETAGSDFGSEEDRKRLLRVRDGLNRLEGLQENLERMNDSMAFDSVLAGYREIFELDQQLSTEMNAITDSQETEADRESQRLEHANTLTLTTLWVATLLSAVLGGWISLLLGRHITRGVDQVASRANAIAAGNLTGAALRLNRRDQVGTLAEAMNRMQASLAGIISTVADTAGSLTGSAGSMQQASDHIHRRMDEQSQQTQQAATAMQEMSASIAEVSRHTQSAAETARNAAQTAREGGSIVKEALETMHVIATAAGSAKATMGLLEGDSGRISQVVTVIDEIARKTNLLALNAAIEAARAGEQGRGFAVVAGEVRRLAESTAHATGEIATMVGGIQARTQSTLENIAEGMRTVDQGVQTTTLAGEALERIIGMAERVDRMIAQIAIAAAQQAMAADQSSASLDSIHTLSNENVNEMATTAAGIETLRGTAVTLERQVDRFQVVAVG